MNKLRLVKSAQRTLEILELFEKLQRPVGVGELAAELGFPISSASMLVHTLLQSGYLNFNATTRQFAPTMRVALLGDWIQAGDPGRAGLKKLIQDARRLTGLTAVLSTRNDIDLQYIHVVRAPQSDFKSRRPALGTVRPLCLGSAGTVLLSELNDKQIAMIVFRHNATRTQRVSLDALMARVTIARRRGVAWEAGEVFQDVGSVAIRIPIDDMFGKPLVLSVAGAATAIEQRHEKLIGSMKRLIRRFRQGHPEASHGALPDESDLA